MENLPEIKKLLENLTQRLDCPLAMLDDELNFLWMNTQALEYFKRKESLPTNLTECAYKMKVNRTVRLLHSGESLEFRVKGRVGKKLYVFETRYCENHMILAAWVDADREIRIEHETAMAEEMMLQKNSADSMQKLYSAIEAIESSEALVGHNDLYAAVDTVQREAYRMYLMLNDLQVIKKELNEFSIDPMRKFNFTEYYNDLVTAAKFTLSSLKVDLKFSDTVDGKRYVNANPQNFAISFLKALKAVVMFIEESDKHVRVSLSEEAGDLKLKISANDTRLMQFLKAEHLENAETKNPTLKECSYIFEYKIAEKMVRRNNMTIDVEQTDNLTTVCMTIPATDDPRGVLRSMRETYLGNNFSTINLVFGDMIQ